MEFIPAKQKEKLFEDTGTKRVCAYCRVSTDDVNQTSSYELQKNHYEDMIKEHQGWELVGIYADEGISGTSLKHRDEKLLECELLHMDETRIQCNKEEGKLPSSESFMWLMCSAVSEDIQGAFFYYSRSRSGENARKLLDGFHGYLEILRGQTPMW